jgi:hypothetical protein
MKISFANWLDSQKINLSTLDAPKLAELKERYKQEVIARKGDTTKVVKK